MKWAIFTIIRWAWRALPLTPARSVGDRWNEGQNDGRMSGIGYWGHRPVANRRYSRWPIGATWVVALVAGMMGLAPSARAQEGATGIYRDRIEAHWFNQGTDTNSAFWYRLDFAGSKREFVRVDAVKGTREPAFDHARVAKALTELLHHPILPDYLPVESLEFAPDGGSVLLHGTGQNWSLDLGSYTVSDQVANSDDGTRLQPLGQVHPSAEGGEDTVIILMNHRAQPVRVFWINTEGEQVEYGALEPGERREQHTFAGHVWLITSRSGRHLGVFTATDKTSQAVVEPDGTKTADTDQKTPAPAGPDYRSPDGKWDAVVHHHDLYLREVATGTEWALTTNATATQTYARDEEFARSIDMDYDHADPKEATPEVYWSPDSSKLVAMCLKPGTKRRVYLIESSPEDQVQPELASYPYLKPGDDVPIRKPHLFDVAARREIPVADTLFSNPWSTDDLRWSADSGRFTFVYNQRGHQVLRILAVDATNGTVQAIVDEQSPTFICYSSKYFAEYLDDTGEIIWMSERDGWNHLYLYDAKTGAVKNQITKGEWVVRKVVKVDRDARQIWFEAGGIRPGQDPYYLHLCRVNFDGTGLTVLTEGDGTHTEEFSPDRRWFIDTWSRVDCPPVNELRRSSDGHLMCRLEQADVTEWLKAGGRFPERFVAKGRDGVTDIYGVIWWPSDRKWFKQYPVIEDIYAGPQDSFVPKNFHARYFNQRLANRGYVVVQMDGQGTSNRSKKFHDYCWQNLADAGFPDRIAWIRAAAAQHHGLDLTRVGIYGTSAGGQDALRGLLDHGDFYRAGVADSGCHDNRMDKIWWNEQWMGWPVGEAYVRSSNVVDAHKLHSALLLMYGEMDRNVDPASTMQVVNALIKANKNFDLLAVPGAGHGIMSLPYGQARLEDFFARHFLGKTAEGAGFAY